MPVNPVVSLYRHIKEVKEKWLAEDGLMRLDYEDDRPPYPGARLRTVHNDNGILWLCYWIYLLHTKHMLDLEMRREIYETIGRHSCS